MCFGCENDVVVPVAQSSERGPVKSRVGTFPVVLNMADGGSEAARVEVNQLLNLDWRLESWIMMGACLSGREKTVVL